jgi:hypothetical protein
MNNDTFIFAICYNCGKILKKALETFFKYHPGQKVHVFGTAKDFKDLKEFKNNLEFMELSGDDTLKEYYKNGHLGTAYVFTKVLKKEYGNYKRIIHFDSDVIFREECLSDIITALDEGYDLVGQRRSYEKNRCNRNDLTGIPDAIGTCFFGANLDKVKTQDFNTLHRMVVGYHNPHPHPILDFFDPVSFEILYNGGKIKYLDYNDYGASNEEGSWDNEFSELNKLFDFGKKFVHFAGIGSGMNFYYNGSGSVPASYSDWAKERFSLYMKLFYNEDLETPYNIDTYEKIKIHF